MWSPFFFRIIPTYGVLPYAMIVKQIVSVDIGDDTYKLTNSPVKEATTATHTHVVLGARL